MVDKRLQESNVYISKSVWVLRFRFQTFSGLSILKIRYLLCYITPKPDSCIHVCNIVYAWRCTWMCQWNGNWIDLRNARHLDVRIHTHTYSEYLDGFYVDPLSACMNCFEFVISSVVNDEIKCMLMSRAGTCRMQ